MKKIDFSKLKVVYVNCTLKKSPENNHTQSLMNVSKAIMTKENVEFLRKSITSFNNP